MPPDPPNLGEVKFYATFVQVANQQTVRTVPVDGLTPEASNYSYQRTLYHAYKQPVSTPVQAFLGYLGSTQGQQPISTATNRDKAGFVRIR